MKYEYKPGELIVVCSQGELFLGMFVNQECRYHLILRYVFLHPIRSLEDSDLTDFSNRMERAQELVQKRKGFYACYIWGEGVHGRVVPFDEANIQNLPKLKTYLAELRKYIKHEY